jgi:hypothetical protein
MLEFGTLVILLTLTFIPSFVAYYRSVGCRHWILLANVALGWTAVVWLPLAIVSILAPCAALPGAG